jgi:hypothetical protein
MADAAAIGTAGGWKQKRHRREEEPKKVTKEGFPLIYIGT